MHLFELLVPRSDNPMDSKELFLATFKSSQTKMKDTVSKMSAPRIFHDLLIHHKIEKTTFDVVDYLHYLSSALTVDFYCERDRVIWKRPILKDHRY